jgi:hypothetical protein
MTKKANQLWVIFHGEDSEVCLSDPGYEIDLMVIADARALAEWHLGRIEWVDALRNELIRVLGRPLATWNRRSGWARIAYGT